MTKFDLAFVFFISFCVFLLLALALCTGFSVGRKEILSDLCGRTNGKYDFCIEVKQWEIKEEA